MPEARVERLKEKIASVREQMKKLDAIGRQLAVALDQHVSLTDPDARSMATSGLGTGMVGYNLQASVDTKHHLIVAHEVINEGHDRSQLTAMAQQTKETLQADDLKVLADRGYFSGEEILKCEQTGVTPLVPKPLTKNAVTSERFDKRDFQTTPTATLSLPGGRARHLAVHLDPERHGDPQVLVIGLPEVPDTRASTSASINRRSGPASTPSSRCGTRAGSPTQRESRRRSSASRSACSGSCSTTPLG